MHLLANEHFNGLLEYGMRLDGYMYRVRVYLTTEKKPTSGDHVGAERRRRNAPPPNPVHLVDSPNILGLR